MPLIFRTMLSGSQRFAIVQCLLQEMLRLDLLVVMRSEIAKHFDLNKVVLSEATVELTESKKRIEELENLELVQACNEVLKTLPLPVTRVITDLVEGVWVFDCSVSLET